MTNRQTRRIWWRRNGRLPACFSGRLVLFVQRLLAMRLARSPAASPLSLSLFSDVDMRGQQTMPP